MVRKLKRDELLAERAAVAGMIAGLPAAAGLTARSLKARLSSLQAEIDRLEDTPDNGGSAALIFGGSKVYGSRAIDADFAVRSLKAFQDLVTKKTSERVHGPLGRKGPVTERDVAKLNITGTIRGSFGFLLQEEGDPALFPTALKEALGAATELLDAVSADDEARFASVIQEVDPRLFSSVREFFRSLHDAEGTVKIVQGDEEKVIGRAAVERAFQRVEQTSIEDIEQTAFGRLIGVLPVSRTFEFTREDDGLTIRGKIGPQMSGDFLQRIEAEMLPLGKRWKAKLAIRMITRGRSSPKDQVTLIDLEEAPKDH